MNLHRIVGQRGKAAMAALLMLALMACAPQAGDPVLRRLDNLDVRLFEADTRLKELQAENAALTARVEAMKSLSRETPRAEQLTGMSDRQDQLFVRVEQVETLIIQSASAFDELKHQTKGELDRLSDELERQKHRIIGLPTTTSYQELKAQAAMLEGRILRLEAESENFKSILNMRASTGSATASASCPDPEAMYNAAVEVCLDKKADSAGCRDRMAAYLKACPDHSLVCNAHFWTGNSFFNEGQFIEAIKSFEIVIKSYPACNKAQEAYLKEGIALYRLDKPVPARARLDALLAMPGLGEDMKGKAQAAIKEFEKAK